MNVKIESFEFELEKLKCISFVLLLFILFMSLSIFLSSGSCNGISFLVGFFFSLYIFGLSIEFSRFLSSIEEFNVSFLGFI